MMDLLSILSGDGGRTVRRVGLVVAAMGLLWTLCVAALVGTLWAVYLFLSGWFVAPAAAAIAAALALLVAGFGLRRRAASAPAKLGSPALAWIQRHPLEASAAALTAGVLAATPETRRLLVDVVRSEVRRLS